MYEPSGKITRGRCIDDCLDDIELGEFVSSLVELTTEENKRRAFSSPSITNHSNSMPFLARNSLISCDLGDHLGPIILIPSNGGRNEAHQSSSRSLRAG
jgi:hypothetical protein